MIRNSNALAHLRALSCCCQVLWEWTTLWWAPDSDKFKEAVRRTAALVCAGIVGLALSPYGLWAAIAAAFVGGSRIGGSFFTAANRLQVGAPEGVERVHACINAPLTSITTKDDILPRGLAFEPLKL